MNKYSRMIKLRLAWWFAWWSLCVLGLAVYILQFFDMLTLPEYQTKLSSLVIVFWLCVFALVVPNKVPSKAKLLKKDLRKNPDNIYAKAMLLEIAMNKQKREASKNKEDDDLKEKIKAMEKEMEGLEK